MFFKSLTTAAVAASALFGGFAHAVEMVAVELTVNGGFETGDFSGWTQFASGPNQSVVAPGVTSGFAAKIDNQAPGSNSIIKNANLGVGVVLPGEEITISFDAKGSFGNGGVAFAEFFSELSGGGTSKAQILGGAPLNGGADFDWKRFSFTTTAGPDVSGGVTLQLGAATGAVGGSFATMYYDNASVTVMRAVPEPETYALMLAGLAVVGGIARRRRTV